MDIQMSDTVRDTGIAVACLYALKEGFHLMGKFLGATKESPALEETRTMHRIETAIEVLAESVDNQTDKIVELHNQLANILQNMHRELVDQKATLAKMEARQEKWLRG